MRTERDRPCRGARWRRGQQLFWPRLRSGLGSGSIPLCHQRDGFLQFYHPSFSCSRFSFCLVCCFSLSLISLSPTLFLYPHSARSSPPVWQFFQIPHTGLFYHCIHCHCNPL